MSGIVGIVHFDGRPVERQALERMTETIAHRGRDGAGHWISGSVGFGHRMFQTTPESLQEVQPIADETGSLCLTLDGRIDNRDELKAALTASGFHLRTNTDAEIVLRAYECWGEDCAAKLIGDFAFAIWDGRRRQLYCARDVVGLKPFFYHSSQQGFLFGSEIQPLFAATDLSRRPNEGMVAEYLSVNICSRDETLFESVQKLPPAHCLTINQSGVKLRCYWDIDPSAQIRYRNDAEYGEHFKALFSEAVRCRLRVHGGVAADLSGGLDSSSIVGMIQWLMDSGQVQPVHLETFSLVFPGERYDESDYVRAVVEKWKVRATLIPPQPIEVERFAEHAQRHLDFPGYPNGSLVDLIPALAKQKDCRVNLKGVGGDDVFVRLRGLYSDSLRQGKFLKAWQELRLALEGGEVSLIPPPQLYLRAASRRLLRTWRGNPQSAQPSDWQHWIKPELARRTGLTDRLQRKVFSLEFADSEQEFLYKCIFDSWLLHSIEMEERGATFYGLEQRQPFRDRRIIEFCCAIPAEQRERKYLTRFAMRNAMRGILPEKIRRRRTKGSFNHLFGEAMRAVGGAEQFHSLEIGRLGWVDCEKLPEMVQSTERMLNGDKNCFQFIWPLWMIYGVELWNNTGRISD